MIGMFIYGKSGIGYEKTKTCGTHIGDFHDLNKAPHAKGATDSS